MAITCCKNCVAPKRYPGCHDHCPEYQKAKAAHDAQKEAEDRKSKTRYGIYAQREILQSVKSSVINEADMPLKQNQ